MKCSLGISNFLEEISSLSHSIVFLYFFALITEEDFLISPCYSLELCIQRVYLPLSCGSAGKESACNGGDLGSIPGLGRSPGEGKGYPLQYSGLENSMDCILHGVTKSWTHLSNFLVFWLPLNHSLVSSRLYWILHSLLYRQICELNSFIIGTRSNSKLPQTMDNLYCYFKQKKQ